MTTGHRLSGYSRQTELLEQEVVVPDGWLRYVVDVAGVQQASDPDAVGSYPIAADRLNQLIRLLGDVPNPDAYDWFLEPFAMEPVHA